MLICMHLDISYETGMKKIYAVKSDGEIISGMEVFRQVYKVFFLIYNNYSKYTYRKIKIIRS